MMGLLVGIILAVVALVLVHYAPIDAAIARGVDLVLDLVHLPLHVLPLSADLGVVGVRHWSTPL